MLSFIPISTKGEKLIEVEAETPDMWEVFQTSLQSTMDLIIFAC